MKQKIFLLSLFCLLSTLLGATTYQIKPDGTGDFTEIQSGINAATANDTILVYPGIYYENLYIENSQLTLASLHLTTSDSSYIANTIIDGNNSGSCILVINSSDLIIEGFTLQNGSGTIDEWWPLYSGGGIHCEESSVLIRFNNITQNVTDMGGGLTVFNTTALLSGNKIFSNHSTIAGGGATISRSNVILDSENLNSIFSNYAATGSDFYLYSYEDRDIDIILEKFTVMEPTLEFIDNRGVNYTFSAQTAAIDQVPHDLYVAPHGDDNNSGLSPEDPLQTIAYANHLIEADENNPRTIYVADGIYAPSTNAEKLPINLKSYLSIIGESEENTIIDCENFSGAFIAQNGEKDSHLKNFTIKNGRNIFFEVLSFTFSTSNYNVSRPTCSLENITIKDTEPTHNNIAGMVLRFINCEKVVLKNITLENNVCVKALNLWTKNVIAENIIVRGTQHLFEADADGTAISMGKFDDNFPDDNPLIFKNVLLENNNAMTIDSIWPVGNLYVTHDLDVYMINGTFTDNYTSGTPSSMIHVGNEARFRLINSIVHDNAVLPMRVRDPGTEAYISHSLFTNGIDDVYTYVGGLLDWQEGNISGDPLLAGAEAEWPYALTASSPAIDAGTLDLPDGIELPEYDLAGNPRIYGAGIDMGAYEFQGEPQAAEEEEIIIPQQTKISNYPNPFSPGNSARGSSTTISLELVESGKTELAIYNSKGQKIKDLSTNFLSMGRYNFQWDGKDNQGRAVASGTYIIKLQQNNLETARKMLVVK